MALRGVLEHPKFAALQERLGLSKFETLGLLEGLWQFASRYTTAGNVGKYCNRELASWLQWKHDPDALVDALVDCRWLDRSDDYRLVVHDWHDWCDDFIHGQLARKRELFVNGAVPRTRRLNSSEKEAFKIAMDSGELRVLADKCTPSSAPSSPPSSPPSSAPRRTTRSTLRKFAVPVPVPVPVPEPVPAPAPVPVPVPAPAPAPAPALKTNNPLSPASTTAGPGGGGLQEQEPPLTPEQIANRIGNETNVVTDAGRSVFLDVARSEMSQGIQPDAIANAMSRAWFRLQHERPNLEHAWGAEKFFGEGHWKDPMTWPWKKGKKLRR
jgi:hypothetical protein